MPDFKTAFSGTFYSLMSWSQLTEFWGRVNPEAGWYLYAIGEPVPLEPASGGEVSRFVEEVDALLRRDHKEDYCAIVYADNLEHPTLIKIFDPNNLGSSCGSGKNPPPLPGWVMSILPPTEMHPKGIVPAGRKRWWQSLFS
ncbi:MAG: hypothetical protein ABIG70_08860 [Pseudomonadota bacterium]|nr:hypothetical protein [Gammaproteobacteria bacterium]MBU1731964.1 hypothetical protein [Gammaproteobacteria bacterium]MBU1893102.1 hypothetical protein [Gammaproteobacteria bacterium]